MPSGLQQGSCISVLEDLILLNLTKLLRQARLGASTPSSTERSKWRASSRAAGRCHGSGDHSAANTEMQPLRRHNICAQTNDCHIGS